MNTPGATARLFGRTTAQYQADMAAFAANPDQEKGQQDAKSLRNRCMGVFNKRFKVIIQRRHDCIHNCDRPYVSLQALPCTGTVGNVIRDVTFLVTRCNGHIDDEFRQFLVGLGFTAATINQVGY
jgi:hypothetical protein